jgi:superfamily I DNA and/or RNA helicase
LNVAITRPKHFLILIGNSETLKKDVNWGAMIKDCKTHENKGGYFPIEKMPFYDDEELMTKLLS